MLTVYGSNICRSCRNFKALMKSRGFKADFIDITENIAYLREFLEIRDTDPLFIPVKERGGVGIPLFVKEDGTRTHDMDEALSWIGQPPVKDEEIVEKEAAACASCN